MNWTDLLKTELEVAYSTTVKLLDKVDPSMLDWKPPTGSNWMTAGQLLKHISEGCGAGCRAFVTGDWGLPEGVKIEDLSPEEMLPPAEKLPATDNVEEVKRLLAEDRILALQMIEQAGEHDLANRKLAAPWARTVEYSLGRHLLQMIQHLDRHKAQLFYYLKLQGVPVATPDLWG
jgi:uncharacterized damage-inducible protein DinB